jgi:thioredoxin 1
MKLSIVEKWAATAAAGLAVVSGAWLLSRTNSGCCPGTQPPVENQTSIPTLGEKDMSTAQARSSVQHANEANFQALVLDADVPVLVDFYADWCGPCQRLSPVLEELAAETSAARIVKVNVDNSPRLAAKYGVESIPNLKVFKKGEVTDQLVGLAGKNELRAMLTP